MRAPSPFVLHCESGCLEWQLGQASQWKRMLRGQGQKLHKIPGYWGQQAADGSWQLQEWRFANFVSRSETPSQTSSQASSQAQTTSTPTAETQEIYYASAHIDVLREVGHQVRSINVLDNCEFLQIAFLQSLVGFLQAICRQYENKHGYRFASAICDSLLCWRSETTYRFLLLPPELCHFVSQCQTDPMFIQQQLWCQQRDNLRASACRGDHNSQIWAYALATLSYLKLCGDLPFPAKLGSAQSKNTAVSEEPPHDEAQTWRGGGSVYIRAQLFRPELSNTYDKILQETLCVSKQFSKYFSRHSASRRSKQNSQPLPDLSAWREIPDLWRDCSEKQRQQLSSKLKRECRRRERILQYQDFWHRKRGIVTIFALLSIFLFSVAYTPLKRALSPPPHSGFSAYEVTEFYYQSIDQLNPQRQSQLSYRGGPTVKTDSNMLTMLFVQTQARRGYEGRDVVLRVKTWLGKEGLSAAPGSPIPALSLKYVPYGISGLDIQRHFTDLGQRQLALEAPAKQRSLRDGMQIVLHAEYDIWLPGTFSQSVETSRAKASNKLEPMLQAVQPLHYHNRDRLTLVYRARKSAWYVHAIRRSRRLISHPISHLSSGPQ